jgi:hypothetical protein
LAFDTIKKALTTNKTEVDLMRDYWLDVDFEEILFPEIIFCVSLILEGNYSIHQS